MSTWVCSVKNKGTCQAETPEERKRYTEEEKKKLRGFCPTCKSRLVEDDSKAEVEEAEPEEDTLVRTVALAREGALKANKAHYNEYVKYLLDDLLGYPSVFHDDFLREWKTGEVQLKLYNPEKRLSGKSLDCVQQAVKAAALSWPDKIPTGEKFQFELPYVVSKGLKWTTVGDIQMAYKTKLSTLKTEPNRFYLVSAQSAATGAVEGHMILIVTDSSNSALLLDFQNQKSANRALGALNHFYVAWSYPRPEKYTVPNWAMEIKLG